MVAYARPGNPTPSEIKIQEWIIQSREEEFQPKSHIIGGKIQRNGMDGECRGLDNTTIPTLNKKQRNIKFIGQFRTRQK